MYRNCKDREKQNFSSNSSCVVQRTRTRERERDRKRERERENYIILCSDMEAIKAAEGRQADAGYKCL